MKVSARTRYGLQLLVYLACRDRQELSQVKEVAREEHLPVKFLEQIIRPLKKAGLLRVSRGAHGGYSLGRDAAEITVGDVFAALDESAALTEVPAGAGSDETTAVDDFWFDFEHTINHYLNQNTIADLARKQLDKAVMMGIYI